MKHWYVGIIVPASILIPLGAGILKKVYRRRNSRVIFWYLVFAGLIDITEQVLGRQHINNLPLLHFYTIAEFLFIARYVQTLLTPSVTSRMVVWLMFLFPALCVIDLFFIQDIHQYNSYPRPAAALIIITLCMAYFVRYTAEDISLKWSNYPDNWIVTGLLLYFCSSLVYFAFLNYILSSGNLPIYFILGGVHASLVMLMYLMFTIGFMVPGNER